MVTTREFYFDASSGDREYQAIAWAHIFKTMFTDGVAPNYASDLEVVPQSPEDMSVRVRDGASFSDGKFFELTGGPDTVSITTADSSNDRIDRIIIQVHYNDRRIYLKSKDGTAGTDPTPPSLQRDASIYEISLAQVYVAAGTSSITSGDITDERADRSVCGWSIPRPIIDFWSAYHHLAVHAPGAADDLSNDYATNPHDNLYHDPDMATKSEHDNHLADTANPHSVSYDQTGAAPDPHGAGRHNTSVPYARQGAQNIWVQGSSPTAQASGDLWVET